MGKYPVIFISLKGVDGLTFDTAKSMLKVIIQTEAGRHCELKDSEKLSVEYQKRYKALLLGESDVLEDSLRLLSELLYLHYGQKTVILIDEYDVPLDKAYENGYYKEMAALIRGFLGQALKTNHFCSLLCLRDVFASRRRVSSRD